MSAGVLLPSPSALPGNGSKNLVEAYVHPPSHLSWPWPRIIASGVAGGLANPTPDWLRKTGCGAPFEDLAIFERIHVIPRSRDFGMVLSDQEVEVEVWNGYRSRAQLLSEILVEGPAGIVVIDPYGQPVIFPATDSKIYRAKALASGDPRIDNLITWIFAGLDNSGSTLSLTGFRILPWPFEQDAGEPIEMEYGYLTDVITARGRTEQRIRLRSLASGSIGLASMLPTAREADYANALLYGGLTRPWGIPLWQFRAALKATAAQGQKTLSVDTSFLRFAPGGLVIAWCGPWLWEVQRVAEVAEHSITCALPLGQTWPPGETSVMPVAVGWLEDKADFNWESLICGTTRLTFLVESFTL